MKKKHFVEQEFLKRGIQWDAFDDDRNDGSEFLSEDDELYLYVDMDEECDLEEPEEQSSPVEGQRLKGPERIQLEKEFYELYHVYMRPESSLSAHQEYYLLEDLIDRMRKLNKNWALYKAQKYKSFFVGVDEEEALQVACMAFYEELTADKAAGKYIEHALPHYLHITHNKTIDQYFRAAFGRFSQKKDRVENERGTDEADSKKPAGGRWERKGSPIFISLEGRQTDHNNEYHPDRMIEASYDPFKEAEQSDWEETERICRKLCMIYLEQLLNYPHEPQKALAVMYGSFLFQLAKRSDVNDPLSKQARKSTKVHSPDWAHERMGNSTLLALGKESQDIVRQYYSKDLAWGTAFVNYMMERSDDGFGFKWADIIYTLKYQKSQTSNWIESVTKSTAVRAARVIVRNSELANYVAEKMHKRNQLRSALKKLPEEVCK